MYDELKTTHIFRRQLRGFNLKTVYHVFNQNIDLQYSQVDEAPMDEIGVFTLHMANNQDNDPSTKWERRRAVKMKPFCNPTVQY